MRTATGALILALLTAPALGAAADRPLPVSGLPTWVTWVSPEKPNLLIPQWLVWATTHDTAVTTQKTSLWAALVPGRKKREGLRLIPPVQYDHPYDGPGELTVVQASSQDEVRRLCPNAVWPPAGAYGCQMMTSSGCYVVIAPETDMKRVGLTKDITLRHEIAHCNGWPGDHRGALPIEDWATDELVKKP